MSALEAKEDLATGDEWLQTYTGGVFPVWHAKPSDVRLEDIAHALSQMCRFGGHSIRTYSVAQHSVLVSQILEPFGTLAAKLGLMHDATEAYLVDVPRPIKRSLPEYMEIERRLEAVIAERFCLSRAMPALEGLVKRADNVALVTEQRDVMGPCERRWSIRGVEPLPERIQILEPRAAEFLFLWSAERLGIR